MNDWVGVVIFLALLFGTGAWISREARAEVARFSRPPSRGSWGLGTAEPLRPRIPTRKATRPYRPRRGVVRSPLARRAEDEARRHLERWTR